MFRLLSTLAEGHMPVSADEILGELVAAVRRVEQRQVAYEHVSHRLIGLLEACKVSLDAILEAGTWDSKPNSAPNILGEITNSLREQESLIARLPGALVGMIYEEIERDLNTECAGTESIAFDQDKDGLHYSN